MAKFQGVTLSTSTTANTFTTGQTLLYAAGGGAVGNGTMKLQKLDCGIHTLTYETFYAGCPACSAERERDQLRAAVRDTGNTLRILKERNNQLEGWYDLSIAMNEASDLLDDDDMAFLKSVLYMFRDEAVSMKVTHGAQLKKRKVASANGFIVIPRRGDPYGHVCTSVGGMAIAGYFDEAANSYGALPWTCFSAR